MNRLAAAVLAAGTVLTFAPAAHAAPAPEGRRCGFTSTTDPAIEGSQSGQVNAGPLVLVDTAVSSGNIVCTIQTGTNDTHAEPDAGGGVVVGETLPVVLAAAGPVTYAVGTDEPVYLCTQVNVVGGGTLYWDDATQSWSADAVVSTCALAISIQTPPIGEEIDFVVCPILKEHFPPDGDVANVWDCPPYES